MSCRVHVQRNGAYRILRLEGSDFTPLQQAEFRSAVQGLLSTDDPSPLVLDTRDLDIVGSCCLAALIDAAMACHRKTLPVSVLEDRLAVLEVFEVVSLPSLVEIRSTLVGWTAPGPLP
jgi:anti-anti-sigma factor